MKLNIAFIGAVGVPNNYGGFEMFLDCCAPEFAKHAGEISVTCDSRKYADQTPTWKGVRRIFIPVPANGPLSVLHDFLAFFAVFWRAHIIVALGVSGGIFFPLFRGMCSLFGKKLIVNVDGIEWRRGKFSKFRRTFLYVSDRLAQVFAHRVVIDNEALREYLTRPLRHTAWLIAYPGDHVIRTEKKPMSAADKAGPQCLTICRIEPENNCHILIEGFCRIGMGRYIFVGNWSASEYGRNLRELYKDCPGLELRDPTYDKFELADLREQCDVYLHGHSVGGTNPSLVEMLFYDCAILAFDCPFNRCTGGNALQYFGDQDELSARLCTLDTHAYGDRSAVRSLYTVERIASAYALLFADAYNPQPAAYPGEDRSAAERL